MENFEYSRQRYSESICSIRTDYVYNNGLIQQAGEIAAFIAGTTFEELLMQLFQDLGMSRTTFARETEDYESMPLIAKPYYLENRVLKRFNFELYKYECMNLSCDLQLKSYAYLLQLVLYRAVAIAPGS